MDIEHQYPTQYKTTESSVTYDILFSINFSHQRIQIRSENPSFHIFNRLAGSLINTTQPIEKNTIYQRNNIN